MEGLGKVMRLDDFHCWASPFKQPENALFNWQDTCRWKISAWHTSTGIETDEGLLLLTVAVGVLASVYYEQGGKAA